MSKDKWTWPYALRRLHEQWKQKEVEAMRLRMERKWIII